MKKVIHCFYTHQVLISLNIHEKTTSRTMQAFGSQGVGNNFVNAYMIGKVKIMKLTS